MVASVLVSPEVGWAQTDPLHPRARVAAHGEIAIIEYTIKGNGSLKPVSMLRWGNPGGLKFGYYSCGGLVEEENTFEAHTIPTRMRVGWHFGRERFETEGRS